MTATPRDIEKLKAIGYDTAEVDGSPRHWLHARGITKPGSLSKMGKGWDYCKSHAQ